MIEGHLQNHSYNVYRLYNVKTRQVRKSENWIWLDKYYESWISKKHGNESGFGDHIGSDDSDTSTNILISKESDLNSKLDPSIMKVYRALWSHFC
jgi:hypothetical protein